MYSVFNARGTVREIQMEQMQNGTTGTSVLLKVGEWQGQNGGGEDYLRFTLWKDRAEMAEGLAKGDSVAVSGYLRSKQNKSGYWNAQLQVTGLVCVAKAQQQGYQQQPVQQPVQAQSAYAGDDIPF